MLRWLHVAAGLGAAYLLVVTAVSCGRDLSAPEESEGPGVVDREVLIQLRPGLDAAAADGLIDVNERFGVEEIEAIGDGWVRVSFSASVEPDEVARAYGELGAVDAAQPNFVYESDAIPSDPRFSRQYAHRVTNAAAGWDVTTGDRRVVIAIIGDGVDLDHEDLHGNIWRNPGEIAGNGVDDDRNGFVDDVNGWDFIDGDNDPRTSAQHETSVAGVAGAEGNNGVGVVGVAWHVSLMVIRMTKVTAQLGPALDYAVRNGASVINLSMSSPTGFRDAVVTNALSRAEAANVVVVASVGNLGNDVPRYPAAFPTVVGVGATDENDARASFSCHGSWVSVAAPGNAVMTTYPGGSYNTAGGTSFAAPYVAGVAALLKARNPRLSAAEIRHILTTSGDAIATDRYVGATRINVAKALGARAPSPCQGSSCGGSGGESGAFSATFTGVRGNNWWVQASVSATATVARVEARADGGTWHLLERMGASAFGVSFFIANDAIVELRAVSTSGDVALSGRYRWPSAVLVADAPAAPPPASSPAPAPAPTPATGALQVSVDDLRGNNWWIEAWLSAAQPLTAAEVRVDGGAWRPLSPTSWGPFVGGIHVPDRSVVELRATAAGGAQGTTVPYRWPDGVPMDAPPPTTSPPTTPPSTGAFATFGSPRGNNWWVEVDVTATVPLAGVDVRVDGGAWRALLRTSWGPWVGGVHMPNGSNVGFRAVSTTGSEALSPSYVWSR